MTDFDFEILAAVAQYEHGISIQQLQARHFKGYDLIYNLKELSDTKPVRTSEGLLISYTNAACLEERLVRDVRFKSEQMFFLYYFITDRGKSLLQNWQRRRAENFAADRRRENWQRVENIIIGVSTGIIATLITSKMLGI